MNDLIQNNIVADNAFGFEPEIEVNYKWEIVERFQKAGVTHLSLSIATDMTSLENTMHYLAGVREHIINNKNFILVNSVDDIHRAKNENKLALSFMFQGMNPLEKNIELIPVFARLGVRSMIIAYNINNAYGGGCIETLNTGLTRLGKKAVIAMNDSGILIDLAHTGYQTSLDTMASSAKPVVFSHSNVDAIHSHSRNLKDDQIKECAQTGGFIGINGNGPLLGDATAPVDKFIDHIAYICDLVGDDYVGLGTDYIYFPEIFDEFMKKNSVVYPADYGVGKAASFVSRGPETLDELVNRMEQRGFSHESIIKVLGANYMRVIKQVWKNNELN
jgi:membrane dipeptidase